jgi:hypothetical protein
LADFGLPALRLKQCFSVRHKPISANAAKSEIERAFSIPPSSPGARVYTPFIANLNRRSNTVSHDAGNNRQTVSAFERMDGAARERRAAERRSEMQDVSGTHRSGHGDERALRRRQSDCHA